MKPFSYVRPADAKAAIAAAGTEGASFLAGGTTLIDLMRLEVMTPSAVVDLGRLAMTAIERAGDGVRIGAMARNSDVAMHPLVVERYPLLSQALLAGASQQVRNMATVGGNLVQRTRCPYFRDLAVPCNKRAPGSGCSALDGYTRSHAILGTSPSCIATHPSDMCVALAALDAVVHTRHGSRERAIPIGEFHTLPGEHPEVENVLGQGELITHVELPASPFAAHARYVKVRDRAAFAFALAAAAVGLDIADGRIRGARVALGGVATKPWRSAEAEQALVGQPPARATFERAAAAAIVDPKPRRDNAFKVALAQRTIVRALELAWGSP
ncbi:MAG: xanthine dehydrogenase family protein subunit M [Deltaproteobacteria bacterium]|nr:MAG: xanthine dehydrogenase family protein subunit M [Deltaproteobacteria bacterium]